MRTVDEWKALLRAKLRAALGAKDKPTLTVVRETLAAIENAEAPPMTTGGSFAGGAEGFGAGEVERLVLTPDDVLAIVERELAERREAMAEYARLGRHEEAAALKAHVDVLATIVTEAG